MIETPLISQTVLPSQEFDKGTKTATPDVLARMKVFQAELCQFGVDMAELARQVKQAGGVWKSEAKVWELPLGEVIALGLEDRIVGDEKSI